MSNPRLPLEILDHIIDHLHDAQDALKNCSLVSKSWIPRTRKRLFANIAFRSTKSLESWKEMFPDPSTSPAHYAKTLFVGCPHVVTSADAEEGGWITGFSHAVRLEVASCTKHPDPPGISLVPFHGFSPVVKYLRVAVPVISSLQIFGLILSFPLLEDLAVMTHYEAPADNGDSPQEDKTSTAVQPSNPPMLTGSLVLLLGIGTKQFTRRLLSLPGGIHFRKLLLTWLDEEDLPLVTALVEGCSHTLESLYIKGSHIGGSRPASINLSKATKLKDVAFQLNSWTIEWVIATLRTTSKHRDLQRISIDAPHKFNFGGSHTTIKRQWLDFDHLLAQFWESHSIRPKVIFSKQDIGDHIKRYLREITRRGIIDMVKCP